MTEAGPWTIEVDALSVFVGPHRLLGPISFRVGAADVLVVMGETGAGKSLLAQAILGALPTGLHAEGRIVLNGRRVDDRPPRARAALWGRQLAMLPQEPWRALDPLMRSDRQVAETHRFVAGRAWPDAQAAARDDFCRLGLDGAGHRLPGALSGGMAQRVAFAAATAGGAPILIADEPTKGLDADRSATVVELLGKVAREGGTLLAITHDVAVARRLRGETIILKEGALVERGPSATVLHRPSDPYTQALLAAEPGNWADPRRVAHGPVLLEAEDLAITRSGRKLFGGFNLTLRAGERISITGPSGVGKTSLLDALAGLLRPSAGAIRREPSIGPTGIQKLYQDPPAAFPARVTLGQSLRDVAKLHAVAWSVVSDLLARLDIHASLLDRYPDSVSGGELQRIAIARALTVAPAILLADEPTSRLDPITQCETMSLIAEIAVERRIGVVLVTHDLAIASNWAEQLVRL